MSNNRWMDHLCSWVLHLCCISMVETLYNGSSCNLFPAPVSFFFFLINFHWSIVDLHCVSLRCTAKWFGYTYTYIHSFLDSFPIQVITEYWVEFPVLYSRSLIVIYFIYGSVYMSIPISQFIPPPLSLLVTISLFSTSVTLFL